MKKKEIKKEDVGYLKKFVVEKIQARREIKDGTIQKYKIKSENVELDVEIVKERGKILQYKLSIPQITDATHALLDELKRELIVEVAITTTEILDPNIIDKLKQKFRERADVLLSEKFKLEPLMRQFLIGVLLHEMVGLGEIEFLLNDPDLEEIVIMSANEPVRVYHKNYGWMETNIYVKQEAQIQNYSNIIARRVGRQITTLTPLLDAHLVSGDRANAVFYPISTKGNTLTIRKFARDPWTMVDFIQNKTCNTEVFALLWLAMQYELNILISGGTASGKTSLLNVCMPFIPPNHRIVSIEQTRELQLPQFLYWCPLTIRQPNPEGKGEVTMLDLVVNSLRMRPDRIILGEIRRKEEAEVLFEAMHTGHSVYATVHANNIHETIQRLVNPPISVPANLLSAVNLNVVMFRDRRLGLRRVYQVGEYLAAEEAEKFTIRSQLIYRWKPETDTIIQHSTIVRLFEDLSRHTGMTQQEIDDDLATKKKILNWLVKNNMRSLEQVSEVVKDYYLNQDALLKRVK